MSHEFDPSRRRLLKAGASGAALAALSSLPGIGIAHAQAKPLSFQLSWIKSIQYGGYFAGIENGSFKKYGIEPTFVSGGPNIDPVANVASGQSQTRRPADRSADRRDGKGHSDQGDRQRVPEEPLQHHEPGEDRRSRRRRT